MNHTRYLLKVIEDYIEKCAVTLKSVRSEIEPLIKELADTDEEYEYMMDIIPYFYRDYFNADKEHLIMTNNNFEEWENVGNEGSVSPNEEMGTMDEYLEKNKVYDGFKNAHCKLRIIKSKD